MKQELKIGTWNCQGLKTNMQGLRDLCNTCDVVLLQETWLEEWESNVINEVDPSFQGRVFSGMDEGRDVRKGRPFAGLGIIWRKAL